MPGLLRPILSKAVKHSSAFIKKSEYRQFHLLPLRLLKYPRYTHFEVKLFGLDISGSDKQSFIFQVEDVFINKLYEFPKIEKPVILDLGANIGLSVLFFKQHYPDAEITAVEADPEIFEYLEKNVENNDCKNIRLINKAVWNENTILYFSSDGADSGHISDASDKPNIKKVPSIDINDLLKEREYDFLKMDIEGAEEVVIPHCKNYLKKIKYIFLEYHSPYQDQKLGTILDILNHAGFQVVIQTIRCMDSLYASADNLSPYSMQLNIFARNTRI